MEENMEDKKNCCWCRHSYEKPLCKLGLDPETCPDFIEAEFQLTELGKAWVAGNYDK